mmetsp:Transcript_31486/g.47594  ORF Transcript_31486/g.47594 Transcript_31486/m.47594 type:complete len:93 (+) Transcript_31486:2603-2881(+)
MLHLEHLPQEAENPPREDESWHGRQCIVWIFCFCTSKEIPIESSGDKTSKPDVVFVLSTFLKCRGKTRLTQTIFPNNQDELIVSTLTSFLFN